MLAKQVFSFKLRGAYNKMASLTPEQREKGVIASSAGNHAQGVALAAAKLVSDTSLNLSHKWCFDIKLSRDWRLRFERLRAPALWISSSGRKLCQD